MAPGDQIGDDQTAFDRAAAHGCAANAYAAAGDPDRARDHFRQLTELAAAITDADERELLLRLYPTPTV